jgi:hypothetical protein
MAQARRTRSADTRLALYRERLAKHKGIGDRMYIAADWVRSEIRKQTDPETALAQLITLAETLNERSRHHDGQ